MQHPVKSPLLHAALECLLQYVYGLGAILVFITLSGIAQVWVAHL